ncbi:porin [Magnetovirga frankeli]|uniref:porin n=1 Tax=Magnetovirga frankeli TaxID=947516 RepID=UPI0012931E91|nr:porin [gamma proteobacterium SS-5]
MNKKILSLAVAAAMTSGVALAQDITIYGQMHASLDYVDSDATVDGNDWATGNHAGARASRLGVKGSEDLGNGLKAIFKIESAVGGNVGSRNTYVGLSGDWGTMLMGRHDTPYKISSGSLDLFGDTLADATIVIGENLDANRFDERVPQTVAYISPNMNGLTVAAAWVQHLVDEPVVFGNTLETNAVSLAAMYSNGPLFASLAYEDHENAANGGIVGADNADAWKLGLGYKANGFSVGLIYEEIDDAANARDAENMIVNASYAMGNNVFKVQFGNHDDEALAEDFDYWAIGMDHNLSKRTKVYALYTDLDNEANAGGNLWCADSAGVNSQCRGNGNDHSGFSFGMVHKF